MAAPHLAVRRAVQESLRDVPNDALVLVACSGGADSLALAGALADVAAREGRSAGGITIDHGLQPGSAGRGRTVAATLVRLGLDPVEVIHVWVPDDVHGPEGNARAARYRALDATSARWRAAAVLLGHTRDDQAESVLLGLARGSGARSLSGMAPVSGRYRRPLLDLPRETVRAAVPGRLIAWDDPHNVDPAFTRARVRHRVLPVLEQELGPGIASALARSASLLRADADALDVWAERAHVESRLDRAGPADQRLDPGLLATYPPGVRRRVLRRAAIAAGCPASDLTAAHVEAIDALVSRWKGQRGVDLPGKLRASRSGGELRIGPVD